MNYIWKVQFSSCTTNYPPHLIYCKEAELEDLIIQTLSTKKVKLVHKGETILTWEVERGEWVDYIEARKIDNQINKEELSTLMWNHFKNN